MINENGRVNNDCDEVLRNAGMFADLNEGSDVALIRHGDCGTFLFRVSKAISAYDLQRLISYGEKERELGRKEGEAAMAGKLRALIGAEERWQR